MTDPLMVVYWVLWLLLLPVGEAIAIHRHRQGTLSETLRVWWHLHIKKDWGWTVAFMIVWVAFAIWMPWHLYTGKVLPLIG